MKRSRCHSNRGTVLIATMAIIVVIAGLSVVMLKSTQSSVESYRQEYRMSQTENVADAAVSLGISKLNNEWLPNHLTYGSMSDTSDTFIIHSGDAEHAPIEVVGSDLRGHPEVDQIDNDRDGDLVDDPSENDLIDSATDDVTADGNYKGGIYHIQLREWVKDDGTTNKIGAEGFDDDGDEDTDEAGEVSGYTTRDSRKFTMLIEASYGNYTIEKRVQLNAIQTTADAFGVYSEGDLDAFPGGMIDSYDSSIGAYGPGNKGGNEGNIGAEGHLTVKNNTDVYGNAEYGDGDDSDIDGTIHGDIKPLTDSQDNSTWELFRDVRSTSRTKKVLSGTTEKINSNYAQLEVDKGGTAVIESGPPVTLGNSGGSTAITSNGGGGPGPKATVKIESQANVFIQSSWHDGADTKIEIDGPTSPNKAPTKIYIADEFTTNNNTDIEINGRVEMRVVDTVDLGPNSTVNVTTDRPPHFSLQVGGDWWGSAGGTQGADFHSNGSFLNLQPNSSFEGVISAPEIDTSPGKNSGVVIKPNGEFYGSLVGRNISFQPGMSFHYDESISRACYLPKVNCSYIAKNTTSWTVKKRGSSFTTK